MHYTRWAQKPVASRDITPLLGVITQTYPCIRPFIVVVTPCISTIMVIWWLTRFLFNPCLFLAQVGGDLTCPGSVDQPDIMWILGRGRWMISHSPPENEQLKWARWLEKEQHLFARWWWLWFQICVSLDSYLKKNDVVWLSIIFQQGWNQLVSYPTS